MAVDVYGNGNVARALVPRLATIGLPLRSVRDSKGVVREDPAPTGPAVAVDCTAPAYSGSRALAWDDAIAGLLEQGTPVVTCNKAPLARSWNRLAAAAEAGDTSLTASATVGAGTPVLAALARIRDAHGVLRVEAVLSGTLSALVRDIGNGLSLDEALAAAQAAGVAEPNPRLDLDGTDAFAKGVILHNTLFPHVPALDLASRGTTFRLDERRIQDAWAEGLVPEAVTVVQPGSVEVALRARPARNALSPPRGHAAVRAETANAGSYHLSGPGAGPRVTAGALVADLLALRRGSRTSPVSIAP